MDTLPSWPGDIGPIFLHKEQIQQRVAELGVQISQDYAGKDLVVIGILKGGVFFMADLLRAIKLPVTVDFLAISRYGPTQQTHGVVNLTKDLTEPLACMASSFAMPSGSGPRETGCTPAASTTTGTSTARSAGRLGMAPWL